MLYYVYYVMLYIFKLEHMHINLIFFIVNFEHVFVS